LLDLGADVNARDGYRGTALQQAAEKGNEPLVQLLLEKGANITEGVLPKAAASGNESLVRLLLDLGADVNARDGYRGTALEQAVANGHVDVARLLLKYGAERKVLTKKAERNLMLAAGGRGA